MSLEEDLIDAVVTDLDDNGTLPEHTTVSYRRPRAIMPEDCPLLCVWLEGADPENLTTDRFDSVVSVGISWHEETVAEAQTLVNDDVKSRALIDALAKIKARVRHLSREGVGVAGVFEVLPGQVRYLDPELQDGLVEGYAHEVLARTTEV